METYSFHHVASFQVCFISRCGVVNGEEQITLQWSPSWSIKSLKAVYGTPDSWISQIISDINLKSPTMI
jgi:hypothetical protein